MVRARWSRVSLCADAFSLSHQPSHFNYKLVQFSISFDNFLHVFVAFVVFVSLKCCFSCNCAVLCVAYHLQIHINVNKMFYQIIAHSQNGEWKNS